MCTFTQDLLSNAIGGLITAFLLYLLVKFRDNRKRQSLNELREIMGQAIELRNIGEHKEYTDIQDWLLQAKSIEKVATEKAYQISPAAGSLLEWLDRVPPYPKSDEEMKYISILSTIIVRIRGIMIRNSTIIIE